MQRFDRQVHHLLTANNMHDMRYVFLLPLALVFTSCATILNSRYDQTRIFSYEPSTVIVDHDTLCLGPDNLGQTIDLERSRADRQMVVIREASTDTVVIRSRLSPVYWLNICNYGVGFVVDGWTSKKWRYPRAIKLTDRYIRASHQDNIHDYYARKDIVNLRISFPLANLFDYTYEGHGRKSKGGFMGISLGVDYFYGNNTFLDVSGVGITDFLMPFPAPIDYRGIRDHMYSVYGSVSNNHMLFDKRFSIGYGISYGRDIWNTVNHGSWGDDATEEEVSRESVYRHSTSIGLVIPIRYYTKQKFYMGFVYRPMFLQHTDKTRFKYQHTVSFDFGWRFRLNPGTKPRN